LIAGAARTLLETDRPRQLLAAHGNGRFRRTNASAPRFDERASARRQRAVAGADRPSWPMIGVNPQVAADHKTEALAADRHGPRAEQRTAIVVKRLWRHCEERIDEHPSVRRERSIKKILS